jgi:hypothetical protein
MTNKKLALLAIVAAAMLVVTIGLYSGGRAPAEDSAAGAELIQGLAPENIQTILVKKAGDTITFERQGDGFGLAEKALYPVSAQKVNDLILHCMDIRCVEKVTDSTANHATLGVADDSPDATVISFLGKDKKPLIGLIIGKSPEDGRGAYARVQGKDATYLADGIPRLIIDPMSYIETSPLDVKKDEIERVDVRVGNDSYALLPDATGKPQLQEVPEGKAAKGPECERVFGALSPLRIKDVLKAEGVPDLRWDASYTVRLKSGLSYTVRSAEKEGKYYVKLSAEGPAVKSVQVSRTESEDELKKKEAIILAGKTAQEFGSCHEGWVYEVGGLGGANLRKSLADLLQDASIGEAPEEISARHILIGYKGAEHSEAERTREEAQALAEEVLAKAKAPGADFAALAREYSEGPSGPDGGDLGSFKKEQMAPTFAEAAFALKVGEISSVVETPFGFHIIMRTK